MGSVIEWGHKAKRELKYPRRDCRPHEKCPRVSFFFTIYEDKNSRDDLWG